jgi:hypothetical protein
VLKLAVHPHDSALSIRYRAACQKPHDFGHQPLPDRAAGLKQLGQVLDVAAGKRITNDRHADGANDLALRGLSLLRADGIAQQERSTNLQHANASSTLS